MTAERAVRTTKKMGMTHNWRSLAGNGVSRIARKKGKHAWGKKKGDF
jgi:hypothetical protein